MASYVIPGFFGVACQCQWVGDALNSLYGDRKEFPKEGIKRTCVEECLCRSLQAHLCASSEFVTKHWECAIRHWSVFDPVAMISGVDMVLARVEIEPQTFVKAVQPRPKMNTRPFSVVMVALLYSRY